MKSVSAPKVRIVLQARTDSSRLPAKGLLPVAGIPSAILAALRAGNKGQAVVLATSDRSLDDLLSTTAREAGVKVFRGSADDVLGRFCAATQDLNDQDIVVRLTADNVLPDGRFIEEMISAFVEIDSDYVNSTSICGDSPYGLGLELMRVKALRKAEICALEPFEREHVTPWLRRANPCDRPESRFSVKEQSVRCTIDTLDDYLRINRAFNEVSDPANATWRSIVTALVEMEDAAPPVSPGPRLVLGTAQLAAPYGSIRKVDPPETSEAIRLVRTAIHYGAVAIDTAYAYPGAEEVLGGALAGGWDSRTKVVTKLSPLDFLSDGVTPKEAADAAEISVLRSLNQLGSHIRPWLLLHRSAHLKAWDGEVWERLKALKHGGLVGGLGVSVQSPAEAKGCIEEPGVGLIQLPFNILDWRWRDSGLLAQLTQRPDLEVHARSIYLQGVLLRKKQDWPMVKGLQTWNVIDAIDKSVNALNRKNIADLCLAYVRSMDWVDGVIIGMERLDQLEVNAQLFAQPALSEAEVQFVEESIPVVPEALLNPGLWGSHGQEKSKGFR